MSSCVDPAPFQGTAATFTGPTHTFKVFRNPEKSGHPPGTTGGPIGGKRVVVLNRPWQTTWQALKEFFAGVGAITRAEIASDEDGRSRGYGTVRFSSEEEAARAIATLNGAEFEGRIITVRMDKYQQ